MGIVLGNIFSHPQNKFLGLRQNSDSPSPNSECCILIWGMFCRIYQDIGLGLGISIIFTNAVGTLSTRLVNELEMRCKSRDETRETDERKTVSFG